MDKIKRIVIRPSGTTTSMSNVNTFSTCKIDIFDKLSTCLPNISNGRFGSGKAEPAKLVSQFSLLNEANSFSSRTFKCQV